MARTVLSTSDAQRKQAWESELWRDTLVETYFLNKFANEDMGNFAKGSGWKGTIYEGAPDGVVHVKADLGAKGRTRTRNGDKLNYALISAADPESDPGVTSGQTLKGKEKSLTWYSDSITLERYRQAVSGGQNMDWNRASFDMPVESRAWLKQWGANKMDKLCFTSLETSPTDIFYKTADSTIAVSRTSTLATAKTACETATGKVTPAFLDYMRIWAITGGEGTKPALRPVMVNGKPWYIYLTHPDVLFDWGNDSTAMQAYREAAERSIGDNPIFSGADYVWKNVIIHTHRYVTVGTDAGAGGAVPWTYGHLLGQQSLVVGFGEMPSIVEDTEDYEEDLFYAWRVTMATKMPTFNSQTYGSLTSVVARTNVSGT